MATSELTFTSQGAGRIPRVADYQVGGHGRALKLKFGRFVTGTSQYTDDGWTAAELEAITGFTRIVAIVPCGVATNGTHEYGWPVGWDGDTRTLRIYAIPVITGGAQVGGTINAVSELATDSAAADSATFDAMVIGY